MVLDMEVETGVFNRVELVGCRATVPLYDNVESVSFPTFLDVVSVNKDV